MLATDIGMLLMLIPYGLVDILPVVSPDCDNVELLFPNNPAPVVEVPGFWPKRPVEPRVLFDPNNPADVFVDEEFPNRLPAPT